MEIVLAYDRQQEFLELVTEYTDGIRARGEDVAQCLSSQHLSEELVDMQKKYGPPSGRAYLALVDGRAAGCAALTKNDGDYCEIKRLYVRPEYRGRHISRALLERAIADAESLGYRYMRLDTFPFMEQAIRLYEKYGFRRVGRYNENPAKTAIFMQLEL